MSSQSSARKMNAKFGIVSSAQVHPVADVNGRADVSSVLADIVDDGVLLDNSARIDMICVGGHTIAGRIIDVGLVELDRDVAHREGVVDRLGIGQISKRSADGGEGHERHAEKNRNKSFLSHGIMSFLYWSALPKER